eukprot:GHVQ01041883.1.p1 GENE.GHVQ01041883.1~~GHVQ01041883.1.p1  ORF type:complete len:124 (-),score=10.81 GHVQ01041883.1:423-794(-)
MFVVIWGKRCELSEAEVQDKEGQLAKLLDPTAFTKFCAVDKMSRVERVNEIADQDICMSDAFLSAFSKMYSRNIRILAPQNAVGLPSLRLLQSKDDASSESQQFLHILRFQDGLYDALMPSDV